MAIFNPSQLTFNGEEIKSISEAVLETVFEKPAITEFHTIEENIVAKKQIAYLGLLSKITKKDAGCGTGATSKQIPMAEKFWDPEQVKIWLQLCHTELEDSFMVYAKQRGINYADVTPTDIAAFVVQRMSDAGFEDALRLVWFNDKNAANVGDTPTGTITTGVSIADYNIINGLWKQIFEIVAADPARRETIAANAEATKALQDSVLEASNGIAAKNVFNDLVNGADYRLRSAPDKVIVATQSLVDSYANYLESVGVDSSFIRIENGFSTLRYRNLELIGFDFWDRTIRADFDNGTKWHLPHRAILTTKSNLLVGVDASSAIANFNVFYDPTTELNNFKGGYKVDAKIREDYMIQVAY
jgi:hypothetical protein